MTTREELVALCDRGVVPQAHWHDRDSAGAQAQLAVCRAYLLAGCDFDRAASPKSDDRTLWIEVTVKGFNYVEEGELSYETYYIPTDARLTATDGKDWYSASRSATHGWKDRSTSTIRHPGCPSTDPSTTLYPAATPAARSSTSDIAASVGPAW